jgi:Flavoprotein
MSRIIVGTTGAGRAVYGIRLLDVLRSVTNVETHVVVSPAARRTLARETDYPPGTMRRGSADQRYQPGEVLAAWTAGAQMGCQARVAGLYRGGALSEHSADVDVEQFHCLVAANVLRIGPQELVKRIPSAHDFLGSWSCRYP